MNNENTFSFTLTQKESRALSLVAERFIDIAIEETIKKPSQVKDYSPKMIGAIVTSVKAIEEAYGKLVVAGSIAEEQAEKDGDQEFVLALFNQEALLLANIFYQLERQAKAHLESPEKKDSELPTDEILSGLKKIFASGMDKWAAEALSQGNKVTAVDNKERTSNGLAN